MVAFSSVYLISSATLRKERLMGVFPLGLIAITVCMILCLSTFPTGMTVSMSLQSPLDLCPYTVSPNSTFGFHSLTTFLRASLAISILALPFICPHILPLASKIITALALSSAFTFVNSTVKINIQPNNNFFINTFLFNLFNST